MRDDRVHLLLKGPAGTIPWDLVALTNPIIAVKNLPFLRSAFLNGIDDGHKEIVTVIFDRSINHEGFLDFLSALPAGFRGDVLMIEESSTAFLASTTGDGRVLFRLQRADLDLYMHARFDVDNPAVLSVVEESVVMEWPSEEAALLTGAYRTN